MVIEERAAFEEIDDVVGGGDGERAEEEASAAEEGEEDESGGEEDDGVESAARGGWGMGVHGEGARAGSVEPGDAADDVVFAVADVETAVFVDEDPVWASELGLERVGG